MTESLPTALVPEVLDRYFEAGVPSTHLLFDLPRCVLTIDPVAQTYELRTPRDGSEPDVTHLQRVDVDTLPLEDGQWFRLVVDCRDVRHEAYGVVVAIVQGMRDGRSFAVATGDAFAGFRAMLSRRTGLSAEQQVGLLGELLLLGTLLDTHDEKTALQWWLGPLAEQHDFAFPGLDVEVKTTLGERRTHVINGTGQLEPNPNRPLWLVSVQLTRAARGDGVSLPDAVAAARGRLHTSRESFVEHLAGLGWRDGDADLYPNRYILRSRPAAYLVDEDFPAVTAQRLRSVVPHWGAVSDVSYRVDLTGRETENPGEPLAAFLATTEVGNG